MNREQPTVEMLRDLLRYDPETGRLFWRQRWPEIFASGGSGGQKGACARWNAQHAGQETFLSVGKHGYKQACIFDFPYLAHRVIWAMQTGSWPEAEVDHRNCTKTDNRWKNLRAASTGQNQHNKMRQSNSTTRVKGVHFRKDRQKWHAQITVDWKKVHVGYFATKEEAAAARAKMVSELHGEFGRAA